MKLKRKLIKRSQKFSETFYYIRPIVRGKETKAAAFGAKVNKLQIDGISP